MPSYGIALDFDGTLADTSGIWGIQKLKRTAEHFGLPYNPDTEARALAGWGKKLVELFPIVFPGISTGMIYEMDAYFEQADHDDPPHLFPGIIDALQELQGHAALTILSSRPGRSLNMILKHRGIHHHFCHIVAGDSLEVHKPDPKVFDCTDDRFAKLGIPKDRRIYVGDTHIDLKAGHARGWRTIIVETGFGLEHIKSSVPFETLSSVAELPRHLLQS